jgi:type II secretory pathway pseudopilin PulG
MRRPRGFTLVELMVALVLALAVGGIVSAMLLNGQRHARAVAERIALQDNVRVSALVLAGDLGAIGRDEISPEASAALGYPVGARSDLLAAAPGAVTYLAARGWGLLCAVAPGPSPAIVFPEAWWKSLRAPRSTDSLLVFAESDTGTRADDAWIHLGIVSVGSGSCPDGRAGIAVRVGIPSPLSPAALDRLTPGSPARLTEVMQMRYYASGGKSWLGMRSVSTGEAITPVAGPLADSAAAVRGLTLVYRDAAGAPTWTPASVRAIDIAILGVTDQPIHGRELGRPLVDSFALTTRVALRNALRP